MLVVERWLLATLRKLTFFSLVELNAAIREKLEWLNNRPIKKMDGSRRSLFEDIDRPALRPLPASRYEFATLEEGQGQYQMMVRAFTVAGPAGHVAERLAQMAEAGVGRGVITMGGLPGRGGSSGGEGRKGHRRGDRVNGHRRWREWEV